MRAADAETVKNLADDALIVNPNTLINWAVRWELPLSGVTEVFFLSAEGIVGKLISPGNLHSLDPEVVIY